MCKKRLSPRDNNEPVFPPREREGAVAGESTFWQQEDDALMGVRDALLSLISDVVPTSSPRVLNSALKSTQKWFVLAFLTDITLKEQTEGKRRGGEERRLSE